MATPKAFLSTRRASSPAANAELRLHATRFLRRVAQDLHLSSLDFQVKVERGTIKRRQRISLATDHFVLGIQDTEPGSPVAISFRTRSGRTDQAGGGNNFVPVEQLATREGYLDLVRSLKLSQGLAIKR